MTQGTRVSATVSGARNSFVQRWLRAGLLLALAGLLGTLYLTPWHSSPKGQEPSIDSGFRDTPLRIRPATKRIIALSSAECAAIHQQIQPPEKGKIPVVQCYHLLRAHGLDAKFQRGDFASGNDLLKLLTNAEASRDYFGYPTIVRTRSGLRFPTRRGAGDPGFEFHRDQCLATFAELGLPVSFPITVDGVQFSVADVLQDSIDNFHLRQQELAWTALAYALYLPPRRAWQNRFGERFSFDDLASALLDRPLSEESCGGSHLLMALAVLHRVDGRVPVFSDETRSRVTAWLRRCVNVVLKTQAADGSWPHTWSRALLTRTTGWDDRPDAEQTRLLLTGHLAEWLLYLPEDFEVPDEALRRAGQWLYEQLKKSTTEDQQQAFCPYTHAVCVLQQLAFSPNNGL